MSLSLDDIGLKYTYDYGSGKNYKGGDKTSIGKGFTTSYESLFVTIKNNPINLLELGVLCGKSLAMWSDYFTNGMIYGIDISLENFYENKFILKKNGAFKYNNVKVYETDITKNNFVDLIHDMPNFDIIIDDALHQPDVQLNNFKILFPKLNRGGYYIIEDIISPVEFSDYFKDIYMCVTNFESNMVKKNKFYPLANKIESITIKQNLIIIKKFN